ncbi:cation diffusion facilitator family transporter [Aquipuribacter hungaricus]|uniref:Cation diffusion facilitator family transporter n=1 Tax=Aquipuribacter hungaricus TaxID=545624 RepID=A0ABV7WHT9_9MICO
MSGAKVVPRTLTAQRRSVLGRRAQLIAGASVTYNVVEAVVAISAGVAASSIALIGFGMDSIVEVFSGLVILWQFRHKVPQARERQALRLIALSFFGLAAYVSVESVRALVGQADVGTSPVGIGLAVASLLVMPFLSWAQRRTGRQLGSGSVVADGTQTLLCTYLSAVLLLGLVLNATLGWSWADPVVGLVIAAVAVKEGLEAWRGDNCCAPPPSAGSRAGVDSEDGCSTGCSPGCTSACCVSPGATQDTVARGTAGAEAGGARR